MKFDPIGVAALFFGGSLILSFAFMAASQDIRGCFKKHWKIIATLVLANFALKVPFKSAFFDGLEYEDAYIYKASARTMYEGKYEFSKVNPYYPTSCIHGSLKDCRMSGIYVTNFLGYPYLVNLGYRLFG